QCPPCTPYWVAGGNGLRPRGGCASRLLGANENHHATEGGLQLLRPGWTPSSDSARAGLPGEVSALRHRHQQLREGGMQYFAKDGFVAHERANTLHATAQLLPSGRHRGWHSRILRLVLAGGGRNRRPAPSPSATP